MANSKIMVVDDDANICELLRLYLEKEGFDPVIAPNGVKALELFDSEKPDLILLDVMMPQLDGWQVCREIRKKSQCPIIMLTGAFQSTPSPPQLAVMVLKERSFPAVTSIQSRPIRRNTFPVSS